MPNKPDQPPAYPAAVHQDAGPYYSSAQNAPPRQYQSPPPGADYNGGQQGVSYNGYSSPAPQSGYYSPAGPQYGPPQQGYYQQGYPQQGYYQGYQQGYPPQGYYAQQPDRGYGGSGGMCAGLSAALALCCCFDLCLLGF